MEEDTCTHKIILTLLRTGNTRNIIKLKRRNNESSSMEQTGMSLLYKSKEPVEEQGNRVRGEEHSGRLQDRGPNGTGAKRKDHAPDLARRGTHWWLL